eukprot:4306118-Pyramimonas_sp.AAC.1
MGNGHADAVAEAGANAHPRPSAAEAAKVANNIIVARAVCLLAAKLLLQWPRLRFDGVEFSAPDRVCQPAAVFAQHNWQFFSGCWCCAVCRKGARSFAGPGPGKCLGPSQLDIDKAERSAHKPALFHVSDGSDCYLCLCSGAVLHTGALSRIGSGRCLGLFSRRSRAIFNDHVRMLPAERHGSADC